MSKNTAKVAQAISLLSDVLANEAESELNEDTETVVDDELEELKEQALEFDKTIDNDLSIISLDLERALESVEDSDDENNDIDYDHSWQNTLDSRFPTDNDDTDDVGIDIVDTDADVGMSSAGIPLKSALQPGDGLAAGQSADEKVQLLTADVATSAKKNAELEQKNEENTDKIEELVDLIRGVSTMIENLHTGADTFVNEVESL